MRPHPLHEVLLVDPDDEIRAYRMLLLRMHGVRTVSTRAFPDTLYALRAGFRPCVVLADPRAPGADGWRTVDELRADSVLATVPMVLITRDLAQAKCAHWHGIRECLGTSADPARVVAAIERHCRRPGRPRRALSQATPSAGRVLAPLPLLVRQPA